MALAPPVLADQIFMGRDHYSGRITEISDQDLKFDLGCSGEIYTLPLDGITKMVFTSDCGPSQVVENESPWVDLTCTAAMYLGAPEAFWGIHDDSGKEYFTTKFKRVDADRIHIQDTKGEGAAIKRDNALATLFSLNKLCGD